MRSWSCLVRAALIATAPALTILFVPPTGAPAQADACGAVMLAGSDWLGGGGVDVMSNGADEGTGTSCGGTMSVGGVVSGSEWQCVELVNRLYLTKGWISKTWNGNGGRSAPTATDSMYDEAPAGFAKEPNGSISVLRTGDVISVNDYYNGSFLPGGHVLVVDQTAPTTNGTVPLVSQNSSIVRTSATLSNGTLTLNLGGGGWSYDVIGVIHAPLPVTTTHARADVVAAVPASKGKAGFRYIRAPSNGKLTMSTSTGLPAVQTPLRLAMGDVDGDGKPDVLIAAAATNGKATYYVGLSTGAGHFTRATALTNQPRPIAIAAGDVTGDGKADLVMAVPASGGKVAFKIARYQSKGRLTVTAATGLAAVKQPMRLAVGDIDGDGKADVVIAAAAANGRATYYLGRSTGDGHFTRTTALTNQPRPVAITAGDVTGDGKADLVTAVPASKGRVAFELARAHGSGHFAVAGAAGLPAVTQPVQLAAGDINGDGKDDVLIAAATRNGKATYYEGLSGGTGFTRSTALTKQARPVAIVSS